MIKQSDFDKLNALKTQLDPTGTQVYIEPDQEVIFRAHEAEDIKQMLLDQHQTSIAQSELALDMFDELGAPSVDESVEVEYYDGVVKAVVDISFDKAAQGVSDEQYLQIRDSLRVFAKTTNEAEQTQILQTIEGLGAGTLEVIFRECRQFDLVDQQARKKIVHVLGRLAYRNLHGRLLVKGILENSSSYSHLRLAIGVVGILNDREAVSSIERHLFDPSLFSVALNAILKIHDIRSLPTVIQVLNSIDVKDRNTIDEAFMQAANFVRFGPEAIVPLFDAYINCQNRPIRPIFMKGLRSFGHKMIPVLADALLQDEGIETHRYMQICTTLGGLKTPAATQVLKNALVTVDEQQQVAIIRGLSHTGDQTLVDDIVHVLKTAEYNKLKSECIKALAHVSYKDEHVKNLVRSYLAVKDGYLYLDALYCLVYLGDDKMLDQLIHLALDGTEKEQEIIPTYISRFPHRIIQRIAQRILNLPAEKAVQIVVMLQRVMVLPREVGPILQQKLNEAIPSILELEIYRLIAKFANTKNELLPVSVLYNAKDKALSDRLQRELTSMIRGIKGNEGMVTYQE